MRVHLALHGYPPRSDGGTQQYTAALARALRGAGNEVTVLAHAPGDSSDVRVREEAVDGQRVLWLCFDPRRSDNPMLDEYANSRVAEGLARLWADERPDVLHVTHPGLLSIATVEQACASGVPAVVTLTDMWAICPVGTLLRYDGTLCTGPSDIGNCLRCVTTMGPRGRPYAALARAVPRAVWRALAVAASRPRAGGFRYLSWLGALARRPEHVRRALLGAAALLSPGRFAVRMLERNGFPMGSVRVMPHGVEAPDALRRAPGQGHADRGALRLGYIGPLARFKGADLPLEAFRSLPAGPDLTLTYYGALPDPSSQDAFSCDLLRAIEATAGAVHRGPFHHAQAAEILADIDVLIVPSLCYENTPMVIYEALASGTPVIATAEGGMRELVEELGGGWLFARGDVADLAARIADLRGRPEAIHEMAATIRPIPRLSDHVSALQEVYAGVIGGGVPHG